MPTRPMPMCRVRGCTGRSTGSGLCAAHQAERDRARRAQYDAARPSAAARGYDAGWRAARAAFLAAHPTCARCDDPATEPHHIVARRDGGTDDWSNLLPLCHAHHSAITAAAQGFASPADGGYRAASEGPRRFAMRDRRTAHRALTRVVHICGAPATGKGVLRAALSADLGLPCYGIDDERTRLLRPDQHWLDDDLAAWVALEDRIDGLAACAVETSGNHANDGPLLAGRPVLRILCTATDEVRLARLTQRVRDGYRLARGQADYVDRLLAQRPPRLPIDHVLDTTRPDATSLARIVGLVERWLTDGGSR